MIEQQIRLSRGMQRHVVVKCDRYIRRLLSHISPANGCVEDQGREGLDNSIADFLGSCSKSAFDGADEAGVSRCMHACVCVILSGLFDCQRGPGVMTDWSAITEAAESMLGSWTLAGWCIYSRAPRY